MHIFFIADGLHQFLDENTQFYERIVILHYFWIAANSFLTVGLFFMAEPGPGLFPYVVPLTLLVANLQYVLYRLNLM